jgi:hypothetical protein
MVIDEVNRAGLLSGIDPPPLNITSFGPIAVTPSGDIFFTLLHNTDRASIFRNSFDLNADSILTFSETGTQPVIEVMTIEGGILYWVLKLSDAERKFYRHKLPTMN